MPISAPGRTARVLKFEIVLSSRAVRLHVPADSSTCLEVPGVGQQGARGW